MGKKENLDIDEVYTYGLANSSFQLQIEDFKNYSGNEVLLSYAATNDDTAFNIKNVLFNQAMDTHPPLYYLLVNFICSIFKGKFSMWFGLFINLVFMVIVFWEMIYLLNKILKNEVISIIITYISFFTYGFINMMVFTRMYVMLSAISLAFIILILDEIEKIKDKSVELNNFKSLFKNDKSFLIKFLLLCVAGIMTQYHFALIAGFFCLIYAIYCVVYKRYVSLLSTFITGIFSIIISIILFPSMITHIFSSNSLHSIYGNSINNIGTKFVELTATLHKSFFGSGLYFYIISLLLILILYVIINCKNKSFSIKKIIVDNETYFLILLSVIFYYFAIISQVKFTFARYYYNIYPLIIIVLICPFYLAFNNKKNILTYLSTIIILVLAITTNLGPAPFSLNTGDKLFHSYLYENKNVKTVLLYRSIDEENNVNTMRSTTKWKLPRPIYTLRDMTNMTFVDIGYPDKLTHAASESISNYDDLFLIIYPTENDQALIKQIMDKNNVSSYSKVYMTNNIHVYRLTN